MNMYIIVYVFCGGDSLSYGSVKLKSIYVAALISIALMLRMVLSVSENFVIVVKSSLKEVSFVLQKEVVREIR